MYLYNQYIYNKIFIVNYLKEYFLKYKIWNIYIPIRIILYSDVKRITFTDINFISNK